MMRKYFIFLLFIWTSCPFASGNTTNHLQFSLGCQAVIPCQQYGSDSNSFYWFYKKDERSKQIQLYFKDKNGIEHHHQLRSRMKVPRNGSLVIDHFTENDQGLYWCEYCFPNHCGNKPTTVISVKKESLNETRKIFYVIAGSSFTHAFPGELTNLKWTFEASNNSKQGPESDFRTSNKSVHIANVKRADAGKYTCWKHGCDGHRQKLFTINLCVITVHDSEDSPVSCVVMCDEEFSNIKPNSTLNVETGTRTISVLVAPNGSLNCSAKQMFDGYSTVNSTHRPSNASNKTTDIPTEPEYPIAVIYGTSAALTCLILMALFICYFRPRLRAAFPVHFCVCGFNGTVEEEKDVVYSSIIITGPAKTTNNHMTYSDSSCVYSEIKVNREKVPN
ncbi:uncharacterized protein LOC119496590 [Sebastes umbrosus]|uniref:uncharacterized protein LOC119496590 n=1 Tax=Sebastes umbrosus TaxID=72105 RepID=UPI00189CA8B1|nr:uncharacterized protein LOC119496590 [Sebastes umbrosus]